MANALSDEALRVRHRLKMCSRKTVTASVHLFCVIVQPVKNMNRLHDAIDSPIVNMQIDTREKFQ